MSIFTQNPVRKVPSNMFDLSHEMKFSCHAGDLIPIQIVEAIPGDVFNYTNVCMARLAPLTSPMMQKSNITTFSFFVPARLIWENFEAFMETPIPTSETPVFPYFANQTIQIGDLGDYMGLPTVDTAVHDFQYTFLDRFSALPYAAYQKIYDDYFRDQNLIDPVDYELTDGLNDFNKFNKIRKRAWQHDYFTSCLPFAQKGQPVEIPLANFRDVEVYRFNPYGSTGTENIWENNVSGAGNTIVKDNDGTVHGPVGTGLQDGLYASTSEMEASSVSINALRWATKLQEFLEKNARGGSRYIELMRQHFGVRSSDARLQRAEFIGSNVQPITISEVLQTSESNAESTPLGEMAGHGLSVGSNRFRKYFAEEHGFYITLCNIRPTTSYSQGVNKMWSRFKPLDFAWPTFAHLGEQEVLNRELFYDDTDGKNDEVFGYIPRYAEYRYQNNRIAGDFRKSLANWHQGRIFQNRPLLNQTFIEADPTKRVFAVNSPSVHNYWIHINNKLFVRRKLPKFGIPSL